MDGKLLLREVRGRPVDLIPGKRVISVNPGEWTSPFRGKGFEPFGYRDFTLGDNPRLIHMPTSARRGVATVVERVALRDVKLMVVVDASASMQIRSKLRILHEAAALLLYAAWQAETSFALAVRTPVGVQSFGLGIGSRHFYHAFRILWELCTDVEHFELKGRRVHLRRCLPPNAMLLYCSDFLDADGGIGAAEALLDDLGRYDTIPVIIQDQLEASFPQMREALLASFVNPETGIRDDAWISRRTGDKIAMRHEQRFQALLDYFHRRELQHIHLDTPGVAEIHQAIDRFFRRRRRSTS